MKLSKTYNLRVVNPGLADQLHPVKNGNLIPEDVTANSAKKVWWLCKKGHEWREKVYLHDRSEGCPLCQKEKPDQKKSRNKLVSKAYRGPYKPIISRGKHGSSNSFQVNTMLEEKTITRKKGKIKEIRKLTTYARYVYGLDRIPEGWVIWHIDGNPLNNNIENLECISRSELLRRNRTNK